MTHNSPESEKDGQFVALLVEHQVAIRSFVRTLLPNPEDAEDVVQTASLTMWRRFGQFQPGTSFRNWAFQVAKFVALKHITRKVRDRQRFSEATMEALAQHLEQESERIAAQRQALDFCIEKLDGDDRQVLAVCYSSASSLKEFADRLERTPNAIYKQLGRIRAALAECVRRRLRAEGIA